VGAAFFKHHPLVYIAVLLAIGMTWFLMRSRPGLVLRAVGESPESAYALGYAVRPIRLAAVMGGGALCGLAGAYISLWPTRPCGSKAWWPARVGSPWR
jgi:ABC-type uncharacterized transport system permease subunit